jgi:hypothetical protein
MSPATAKSLVSRAMFKFDARDRAQLVILTYQAGFGGAQCSCIIVKGRIFSIPHGSY